MNPLYSIIIPCRYGWPQEITDCLKSIEENTQDFNRMEMVIKVDHDDPYTLEAVKAFEEKLNIKIIIMDGNPRKFKLVDYSNTLAWNTSGTLIWWWSDEARMLTKHWDAEMLSIEQRLRGVPSVLYPSGCCYQPMVTRKWLEITGRFTFHMCIDSYLGLVGGSLHRDGYIEVIDIPNVLTKERPGDRYGERCAPTTDIAWVLREEILGDLEKIAYGEQNLGILEYRDLNDPKVTEVFDKIRLEIMKRWPKH